MTDDLEFMSISEQADLLSRREVTPLELTDRYLDRIDRFDPQLCSHITVLADSARAAARSAERALVRGEAVGPLHGIPYGVKDQLCTAGVATTLGSRVLADFVPDRTATVIDRLDAAGAILVGKHNLHELGKGGTVRFPYGYPLNPWSAAHTSSSSSNGSGVAVAAGLCTFALGEDTGGSIRGPAAAMSIVGLRPTFGRVSRHGGVMYGWMADTIGPMTRTVRDAAIVLEAIAGYDAGDALTSRRPVPRYQEGLTDDLRGVAIGLVRELTWAEGLHPAVERAMRESIDVFRSLGATVDEVSLPTTRRTGALTGATTDVDVAAVVLHRWLRERWDELDVATRTRMAAAALVPGSVASRAMRMRVLVRQEVLGALDRFDVLLSPANLAPPTPLQAPVAVADVETVRQAVPQRHTARPFAIANTPTLAVPAGFSDEGLPVSLQIAGRLFDEAMVFRVGHAYEQATAWHQRHPDVARTLAAAPASTVGGPA